MVKVSYLFLNNRFLANQLNLSNEHNPEKIMTYVSPSQQKFNEFFEKRDKIISFLKEEFPIKEKV
jgi:hypothetical protein